MVKRVYIIICSNGYDEWFDSVHASEDSAKLYMSEWSIYMNEKPIKVNFNSTTEYIAKYRDWRDRFPSKYDSKFDEYEINEVDLMECTK